MTAPPVTAPEIHTLTDWHGYYAKGHHGRIAFIRALYREHAETYVLGRVRYQHVRWINLNDADAWECGYTSALTPSKPGRGAFEITLVGDPL